MINPKRFRAEFISFDEIAKIVSVLRAQYPLCNRLPLDILVFAEHDLKLDFQFAPIQNLGQDAFLLSDLSGIVFDSDSFISDKYSYRLRFSVAHELGHFFLHKSIYKQAAFSTIEEWLDYVDAIPKDEYQKIEWQADEFAGQLLVPIDKLKLALEETITDAGHEGMFTLGEDAVLDFCCKAMQREFGVSISALATRLRRSKLWPHPRVPGSSFYNSPDD